MTQESPSFYIHGSSPEEQWRLSLMNDLLNDASLLQMGLERGDRVLDIGCGTGQFTRRMANAVGEKGMVVGMERDPDQLKQAQRLAAADQEEALVEFRPGDATRLDLKQDEWGTFDVVHARFLLEHVRQPESVVENMVRATRPGGRIVLADDDHEHFRPWPEPNGFPLLWKAYIESYVAVGNDPFVGRRLVNLLHEAGVVEVRNTSVFFGGNADDPFFSALADNLIGVVRGAEATMLEHRLISRQDLLLGLEGLRSWKSHPSATLWYYVCWAEGINASNRQSPEGRGERC